MCMNVCVIVDHVYPGEVREFLSAAEKRGYYVKYFRGDDWSRCAACVACIACECLIERLWPRVETGRRVSTDREAGSEHGATCIGLECRWRACACRLSLSVSRDGPPRAEYRPILPAERVRSGHSAPWLVRGRSWERAKSRELDRY